MEHLMDDSQKEEFFELIEEMKIIAKNINQIVSDDNKAWKIKLQFAMIRDLVWQAEALIKGGNGANDF
jgi:hypothetical protein